MPTHVHHMPHDKPNELESAFDAAFEDKHVRIEAPLTPIKSLLPRNPPQVKVGWKKEKAAMTARLRLDPTVTDAENALLNF